MKHKIIINAEKLNKQYNINCLHNLNPPSHCEDTGCQTV